MLLKVSDRQPRPTVHTEVVMMQNQTSSVHSECGSGDEPREARTLNVTNQHRSIAEEFLMTPDGAIILGDLPPKRCGCGRDSMHCICAQLERINNPPSWNKSRPVDNTTLVRSLQRGLGSGRGGYRGAKGCTHPVDRPQSLRSPGCVFTTAYPIWMHSVREMISTETEIGILRLNPVHMAQLANRLEVEGVKFFWPRHRRQRGRKMWECSMFPGLMFVDVGKVKAGTVECVSCDGRNVAEDFCNFFGGGGWKISWTQCRSVAMLEQLKQELLSLEIVLRADPFVVDRHGIERGKLVRVVDGPLMGCVGEVLELEQKGYIQVALTLLQRSIITSIGANRLEVIA